jgi:hypothetical protein
MWLEKVVTVVLSIMLTTFMYTVYYPQIIPIDPAIFIMSLIISVIITDLTYPYIKELWKQRQ